MLLRLMLTLVPCGMLGCVYEGYVPKAKHEPLAATEMNIATLPLGKEQAARLGCAEGICRVRHRLITPQQGELVIRVEGPTGDGPGSGPRIGRVVLEGTAQQVLDIRYGADSASPLVVKSKVNPGVHFVLIQGLGGAFDYRIQALFTPGEGAAAAPVVPPPAGEQPATSASRSRIGRPSSVSRGAHEPGDISDGADYAYDPSRDLRQLKRYAFAQDPAAELQGDRRFEGNPFVKRQIQREIRYYLADLAIYQVDAAEADFLISVQVGARSTTWYSLNNTVFANPYESYLDTWGRAGLYVRPHTYVDGTLVIDFIDGDTGDLVWHGWTSEPVPMNEDDEVVIKNAVRKVLAQF